MKLTRIAYTEDGINSEKIVFLIILYDLFYSTNNRK